MHCSISLFPENYAHNVIFIYGHTDIKWKIARNSLKINNTKNCLGNSAIWAQHSAAIHAPGTRVGVGKGRPSQSTAWRGGFPWHQRRFAAFGAPELCTNRFLWQLAGKAGDGGDLPRCTCRFYLFFFFFYQIDPSFMFFLFSFLHCCCWNTGFIFPSSAAHECPGKLREGP